MIADGTDKGEVCRTNLVASQCSRRLELRVEAGCGGFHSSSCASVERSSGSGKALNLGWDAYNNTPYSL